MLKSGLIAATTTTLVRVRSRVFRRAAAGILLGAWIAAVAGLRAFVLRFFHVVR